MTKLEELKSAYHAAYDAYQAELNKENTND